MGEVTEECCLIDSVASPMNTTKYLVCKVCDASFIHNTDLLNHFKTHNIKLEHVCVFCGRDYEDDGDLINHMLTHTDVIEEYNQIFIQDVSTLKAQVKDLQLYRNDSEIKIEFEVVDVTDDYCVSKVEPKIVKDHDQSEVKFDQSLLNSESDEEKHDADDLGYIHNSYFVETDKLDEKPSAGIPEDNSKTVLKITVKQRKTEINSCTEKRRKRFDRSKNTKIFKCDECDFEAPKLKIVRQHVQMHCDETIYCCRECDFSSKLQYELRMHNVIHSPGELLECPKCDFKTTNSSHYKRHNKLHQKKSYFCEICNKTFSRKDHVRAHSNERHFRCSECPVTYKDRKWLKRHLLFTHNVKHVKKQKLLKITSIVKEGQFKCDVCEYLTNDNDLLLVHKKKHEGGWPFVCDECNYRTKIYNLLKGHMIIHKDKCIFCEFCGKSFRRIYNLREHLRTHSDERNFCCTKCPKSYKDNKSLKSHLLHAHMDEQVKSFKCDQCDFRAATLFILGRHVRRHNPENAYRCDQCKYSCRTSDTLKKHSLIHRDYPVASCPHCEFKSVWETAVKRHMRVHRQDLSQAFS